MRSQAQSALRRKRIQKLGFGLMALATLGTVLPIILIVVYIFAQGIPGISWEFLTQFPREGMRAGGILPAIVGTLWLTLGTAVIAVPLGVGAAIYLAEYAPDNRWTRAIRVAIINLAGIPSVVYGLFGLGLFVLFLQFGTSILAASLTLAVMTPPVVIVATREALQAVPHAFREACWNMGATRWQTIRKVVLPNAVSGILTGIILEVSRTAGQTAPIMFTGAAFATPFLPSSVFDQTMALSLHLFSVTTQIPDVPEALPYGVALVLISIVLMMNSASIGFRMYLRGQKKW